MTTLHPEAAPAFADTTAVAFYRPELDVLRFCAFLFVFLHHAFPNTATPYLDAGLPSKAASLLSATLWSFGIGVDLFFVLSAYLITDILLRELRLRGSVDVGSFYVRRILRIWPLYFAFLALCVWVVPHVLPGDHISREHLIGFVTFTENWITAFYGYPNSVAAPLWSISLEEQFYVVWPLLIVLTRGRHIIEIGLALLVLSMLYRLAISAGGWTHPAMWTSTISHLDSIALGAMMSVMLRNHRVMLTALSRLGLLFAGVSSWILVIYYLGHDSPLSYPLIATSCAAMLLATLRDAPDARQGPAPLIYLGRISYGLYVYHVLAISLVGAYTPLGWGSLLATTARALVALGVTIVLAAISYHCLEFPFLRLKRRFSRVPSRDVAGATA